MTRAMSSAAGIGVSDATRRVLAEVSLLDRQPRFRLSGGSQPSGPKDAVPRSGGALAQLNWLSVPPPFRDNRGGELRMGPSSTKPPNLDPPLPYTSESAPDDGTPSERARKCARALHWIVIFVILSVNVIGPSLEGFCSLPTSCRYGGFEITFEPDIVTRLPRRPRQAGVGEHRARSRGRP